MGVLHRLADRDEQLQTRLDRQPPFITVLRQWLAVDEFHHEERLSRWRQSAVENAGDVGVVHQCQGLAFGVEPSDDAARIHAGLDEFQRDLSLDRFGLIRSIDRAHSSLANHFDQCVALGNDSAEAHGCVARRGSRSGRGRAGVFVDEISAVGGAFFHCWIRGCRFGWAWRACGVRGGLVGESHGLGRGGFEDAVGIGVGEQEPVDLGAEVGVPSAGFVEVAGAHVGGEIEDGEEDVANTVRVDGHDRSSWASRYKLPFTPQCGLAINSVSRIFGIIFWDSTPSGKTGPVGEVSTAQPTGWQAFAVGCTALTHPTKSRRLPAC